MVKELLCINEMKLENCAIQLTLLRIALALAVFCDQVLFIDCRLAIIFSRRTYLNTGLILSGYGSRLNVFMSATRPLHAKINSRSNKMHCVSKIEVICPFNSRRN